jgi:diguanylate cyclase (GGDEF)-like protein
LTGRHQAKDGRVMDVEITSNALVFGGVPARIALIQDVTERRLLEAERERRLVRTEGLLSEAVDRADRDPLTGLWNHRAFHRRLEEEAAHVRRDGGTLAVAMLDLDNFKFFNDAYGHVAGDAVLRRVAEALCGAYRPHDTIARFGGDEFALLIPLRRLEGEDKREQTRAALAGVQGRLSEGLSGLTFLPPGHDCVVPLTVSFGVALYPHEAGTQSDVIPLADERLFRAKCGPENDATEALRRHLMSSVEGYSMLDALLVAVDNKDRYTRRHSEDVMTYSLQIAQELEFDEATQRVVAIAALLHDVGKIGVPNAILRKPGRLTGDEFQAVQKHPLMGAIIVGAVPGFEETLDAIRYHHERWDGTGYPFGLDGKETPLMARLMAVADAYSAMTTDRPYRAGMGEERALKLLEAGAGTQWDPACVHAFLRARRGEALGSQTARAA